MSKRRKRTIINGQWWWPLLNGSDEGKRMGSEGEVSLCLDGVIRMHGSE
jgi:hypothetical protein